MLNSLKLLWIVPLLSVAVEVPPDSNETTLGVAVGGGSYSLIARDCSGRAQSATEVPFVAGSVSIERGLKNDVVLGAKVDYFRRNKPGNPANPYEFSPQDNLRNSGMFITPYFGIDERGIGIAVGAVIPTHGFDLGLSSTGGLSFLNRSYDNLLLAGKIRFGELNRITVESSFNFNSPLVAGGGLVDVGIGIPISDGLGRVWLGLDSGPYEASGLLLKTTVPLSEQILFTGSGRFARAGIVTKEYGWSAGFKYRWH